MSINSVKNSFGQFHVSPILKTLEQSLALPSGNAQYFAIVTFHYFRLTQAYAISLRYRFRVKAVLGLKKTFTASSSGSQETYILLWGLKVMVNSS
jgi:hypothetical protein